MTCQEHTKSQPPAEAIPNVRPEDPGGKVTLGCSVIVDVVSNAEDESNTALFPHTSQCFLTTALCCSPVFLLHDNLLHIIAFM